MSLRGSRILIASLKCKWSLKIECTRWRNHCCRSKIILRQSQRSGMLWSFSWRSWRWVFFLIIVLIQHHSQSVLLQHSHEEVIIQMRQQRPQIISINETDDAKSQVPNFMMVNPFDSRMSRRVKRAYSNLDQLGVRLGVFLRRYPLARIFSVFYVTFLHFFVVFVLLSSTPAQ